jgi:hypothetical protein
MWEPRRLTVLWASTACYRDALSDEGGKTKTEQHYRETSPAYGSATQVLRGEAKKENASKMQFLQANLCHKTSDVQEEDRQNSSFSFGTGRDSIWTVEKEEQEDEYHQR